MEGDVRSRFRIFTLLALLALALGAAACGDDDDGGEDGASKPAASTSQDGVDPADFDNTPDGQVRLVYAQFVDAFYDKKVSETCALMTARTQKDVATGTGSCEAGLRNYFKGGSTVVKDRPRIVRLKITGSRAVAITQVKGSARYPVPFAKQDGQWKVNGGWTSG
ncbi:MAG TPA: hypothetical protein VEX36_07890 [Thermoleophilaceae bacterium]|nr:hypothetical protein [Thermoleophilaceae bacterium]